MSLQAGTNQRFVIKPDFVFTTDTEGPHPPEIFTQNRTKVFEQGERERREERACEEEQKTFIILLGVFSGKQFGTNRLFFRVISRTLRLQCR